jgi:hypothetical protein
MECQRKILGSLRGEEQVRPFDLHSIGVGAHFRTHNFGEFGTLPFLVHQHDVRLRKGAKTVDHSGLRLLYCLLASETPGDNGLHYCEQILRAMVYFVGQQLVSRLGQFALGNVTGDL